MSQSSLNQSQSRFGFRTVNGWYLLGTRIGLFF